MKEITGVTLAPLANLSTKRSWSRHKLPKNNTDNNNNYKDHNDTKGLTSNSRNDYSDKYNNPNTNDTNNNDNISIATTTSTPTNNSKTNSTWCTNKNNTNDQHQGESC